MVDPLSTKKTTPGQDSHRRQWILDVVRANQDDISDLLIYVNDYESMDLAKILLNGMHKQDRDAILQPNGILTDQQIEALK